MPDNENENKYIKPDTWHKEVYNESEKEKERQLKDLLKEIEKQKKSE